MSQPNGKAEMHDAAMEWWGSMDEYEQEQVIVDAYETLRREYEV